MLSDPSTDNEERQDNHLHYETDVMETETGMLNDDVEEDELVEKAQGPIEHIHNWVDLQKDIKDHSKKYSKNYLDHTSTSSLSSQILPPYG